MVLLCGIQTLFGPVVGAAGFTLLQDYFVGITEYWRALFGAVILLIVLVFPQGIAGYAGLLMQRGRKSRSEEHTSELQSLMRISYAVFCLKKKKKTQY